MQTLRQRQFYAVLTFCLVLILYNFYIRNENSPDLETKSKELLSPYWETNSKELFSRKVVDNPKPQGKGTRTYHSSAWEQWWLDNIEQQEKDQTICTTIATHEHAREFLFATATKKFGNWLFFDDHTHGGVWFNVENGKFTGSMLGPSFCPDGVPCDSLPLERPITTKEFNPTIFSWFETKYENGVITRDYIEPLVGHLRHPMSCTETPGPRASVDRPWLVDRTYIVPPPVHMLKPGAKALYYDAGASHWCSGAGGGSLCFFTKLWEENGIIFDRIRAWDGGYPEKSAQDSYPIDWRHKIQFSSSWISTSPQEPDLFVPLLIKKETSKDDYVLFKLDIDHGDTEIAIVNYLLDDSNDAVDYIDEFVWEQHCNNYIMLNSWVGSMDMSKSIADSYQYFWKLRKRGVRAHSYV